MGKDVEAYSYDGQAQGTVPTEGGGTPTTDRRKALSLRKEEVIHETTTCRHYRFGRLSS